MYYSIFIWSSTCFGWHAAHHQEPKTALTASGFFIRGRLLDVVRHSITVPDNVHQLHVQQPSTYEKTRGCQCSFRLLMMGDVSPETCWASYRLLDVVRHSITVPDNVHQLHVQQPSTYEKTRGCQCSFRLLMIGGVSPETCWASYKYGIIKVWYIVVSCWIFLWIVLWCTNPRTSSL
jgi:hypothetical protein